MSLLQVDAVTMRFGGLVAVENVSFEVKPGEIFAVIGPNGAGKTTLFNAITGIYQPSAGSVRFEGREIRRSFGGLVILRALLIGVSVAFAALLSLNATELWNATIKAHYVFGKTFDWKGAWSGFFSALGEIHPGWTVGSAAAGFFLGAGASIVLWSRSRRTSDLIARAGIARTFQNIRLFAEMNLIENVLVGMHARLHTGFWTSLFRLPKFFRERRHAVEKAMSLLHFVGLDGRAFDAAKNLPYGLQRRLEIARALASKPRLLLLDEPAAGMNPTETVGLMELIRQIRATGVTVLLIEHHMRVVMGISDRITVLNFGRKIAEGTPQQIRDDPHCVEAYLGREELG